MHGQNPTSEQAPHLAPALTAVILGVVLLEMLGFYARSLESRSIAALAADEAMIEREGPLTSVKNQGIALQQAALEDGRLLPIYGSSELVLQAAYNRPFHATSVFRDLPTGFAVFPVGKSAHDQPDHPAEAGCGVGPALRGRKVAISLSPFWFFERLTLRADGYAGDLLPALQAGELAFNPRLSLRFRQEAARRMLQYPSTVANRPLLRFVLENLADGSPFSLACYDAVPASLGTRAQHLRSSATRITGARGLLPSWGHPSESPRRRLRRAAAGRWIGRCCTGRRTRCTALGPATMSSGWDNREVGPRVRLRERNAQQRHTRSDEGFLDTLRKNQEWGDLELLLRELNELGARPLLLSMPIHGPWYDECGVTFNARRAYYETLRGIGARYHAPVVDFADHDADRSFCHDDMGHLAPRGLLYYNQVLDGFYHDAISHAGLSPSSRAPVASRARPRPASRTGRPTTRPPAPRRSH